MTELLYRLIAGKKTPQQARTAVGKTMGIVAICVNLLLAVSKLLAGSLAGSVAVTADGLNNLSDTISGGVTFAGFRLAERPADTDHPFGHARFEYLAGLAVSALILFIGFQLMVTSFGKIIHPIQTEFTWLTFAVLGISVLVKLGLFAFGRGLGKKIESAAVLTTADDSRNDVVTTSAVLVAAVVARLFHIEIDGWVGLAVSLFILYCGMISARDTINLLLGEAVDPKLQHSIEQELRRGDKVIGVHDMLIHDYGPGARFASAHVEMDAREDSIACHEIIDALERAVMEKYSVHLVIHFDPVVVGEPELDELHGLVCDVLAGQDSRLGVHDFRRIGQNLIFDVSIPYELRGREAYITKVIESALSAHGRSLRLSITFDTV